MRSADRQLCALFRRIAASTSQVTLADSNVSPCDDFAVSTDKVDCERGDLDRDFLPRSSRSTITCYRLLKLAGLLSLVLLVQRFWHLPSLLHGWERERVVGLDDLCPQVEPLTPVGHEALLASLDKEFISNEFQLKAYESLGGAVRIPSAFSPFSLVVVLMDSVCALARNLTMTSDPRLKTLGGKFRPSSMNISSHVFRWCECNTRSTRLT